MEAISAEIESRPDKFIRRECAGRLATVRERIGNLVGAETDEIVLVQNATHGISTVLRNLWWEEHDVIVGGELFPGD